MLEFINKLSTRAEIYTFLCRHGDGLRSDKDFEADIKIKHIDGSEFHLNHCTWEQCEHKIYIWTEHCGYLYFYKDDLKEMEIRTYEWDDETKEQAHIDVHTIINFNMEIKQS